MFHDGVDPAILGPHLIDGDDGGFDLVVPVALVNGYHFWVVVKSTFPGEASAPWFRDKGELVAFQAKGVHLGHGSEVPEAAAASGFSHIRHVVLDRTWGKRMVMRSTGPTASHNKYDRQRKSMQSCTSAWNCHNGAHGQRPQMKQSK